MTSYLFYIEPRIDNDSPTSRQPWRKFTNDLIATLFPDGVSADQARIITNDLIASGGVDEALLCKIEAHELASPFDGNPFLLRRYVYREEGDPEAIDGLVALIRDRLRGFVPDVIVSFTPVPFLKKAFPDALVLHHEVGGFSRAPYPQMMRLDPFGMIEGALPAVLAEPLARLPATREATEFVDAFRETYINRQVQPASPFKGMGERWRSQFDFVWLLPLGSERAFIDYHVSCMSQFEFVCWVLERVPPTHGVVIIENQEFPVMRAEHEEYLGRFYPNLLFPREALNYNSPSQYMLEEVDGVITVCSSLGFPSALWRKKLIVLHQWNYLEPLAWARDLTPEIAREVAAAAWTGQADAVLHWLLRHYFIPPELFHDRDWLTRFIERNLTAARNGRLEEAAMVPFLDDDARLLSMLLSHKSDVGLPQARGLRADRYPLALSVELKAMEERIQRNESKTRKLLAAYWKKEEEHQKALLMAEKWKMLAIGGDTQ